MLRLGTVLGGRYRLVEYLGSGGMADVYRAQHIGLAKMVAIKVLPAERAPGGLGARFEAEARAAARLDHPGCVRVLDFGRWTDGSRYLAMELMLGPTLADRLARIGRLDPDHAVRVAGDLLSALGHAHRQGVLHRDIKPANVMFTIRDRSEHTVLIDFGLARLLEEPSMTATGTCVGSPSYVAPERLLEHPYDVRADLYSVGVLLFELLAGRRPFVGLTTREIVQKHLSWPPPPLEVPAELDAVIRKSLAKDPDHRFDSAEAMHAALIDAIGYEPSIPIVVDAGAYELEMAARAPQSSRWRRFIDWAGAWRRPRMPELMSSEREAHAEPRAQRSQSLGCVSEV